MKMSKNQTIILARIIRKKFVEFGIFVVWIKFNTEKYTSLESFKRIWVIIFNCYLGIEINEFNWRSLDKLFHLFFLDLKL